MNVSTDNQNANEGETLLKQGDHVIDYNGLVERIGCLEDRVSALEDGIDRPVTARKLSKEDIRAIIMDYVPTLPRSEPIYPSDIAYRFALDPDDVEKVMDELVEEGFLK